MVHFVGAGSGAVDLITVRGARLLQQADVIIYAGSLVNKQLLEMAKEGCQLYDSAQMTLEQVIDTIAAAEAAGKTTVRLHTGDPSIYGAVREQFDQLLSRGIAYDVCPGVSSFCGAAAALKTEYTLPDVSQTVIITRAAGRTPVPERESIRALAAHQATMVLFLSTSLTKTLQQELQAGGYPGTTPAAVVYKATWPEERIYRCTVETLHKTVTENGLTKTALIVVGDVWENAIFARCCTIRASAPVFGRLRNESGRFCIQPPGLQNSGKGGGLFFRIPAAHVCAPACKAGAFFAASAP